MLGISLQSSTIEVLSCLNLIFAVLRFALGKQNPSLKAGIGRSSFRYLRRFFWDGFHFGRKCGLRLKIELIQIVGEAYYNELTTLDAIFPYYAANLDHFSKDARNARPFAASRMGTQDRYRKTACRTQAPGKSETLKRRTILLTGASPFATHRGFVLPMTLWVIAIVGLVAAAVNTWVETAVRNAQTLRSKTEAELTFVNAVNEMVFLMATQQMSYRGLEVGLDTSGDVISAPSATMNAAGFMVPANETDRFIAFDGRPYVLESDTRYTVAIQDGRGLFNLNAGAAQFLRRLLAVFNVAEPVGNRLADTLQDYIDQDDLNRLSGAERADYERLGLSGPANGILQTPAEAQSILDWNLIPEVWKADLEAPIFTTCQVAGFNPNTAPEPVLHTYITGLTPENARDVIARRAKQPFRNAREFAAAAGLMIANDSFFFSFTPAQCVVVDLTDRVSNERLRFSLSLTPLTNSQPWRIDYAFKVPAKSSRAADQIASEVVFPTPETIDRRVRGNDRASGIR